MIARASSLLALAAVSTAAQTPPAIQRVFPCAPADTPQMAQALVNILRAIGNIAQVSYDAERKAITVQTSPAQADLAEWLFSQLDSPGSGTHEYVMPSSADDVVRVFHPTHPKNPQQLQELINGLRSLAEIQRIAAFTRANAVAARGALWQAQLAEWIIEQLDHPPVGQPFSSYSVPGVYPASVTAKIGDPAAVRIFWFSAGTSPQALQEMVNTIRVQAHVPRIVAFTGPSAIALRATYDEAIQAERLLADKR